MTAVVAVPCRICKSEQDLTVSIVGFNRWIAGELIQEALPELDADQRELLISNTCPKCFDEMFPSDKEE